MPNLWVSESFVNATTERRFSEVEAYETAYDDLGQLYRAMRNAYGRCVSSVYVDTVEEAKKVGWVFQSRQRYDDCQETYLREVWVTVHKGPPEHTTTYKYADFPR